MRALWNFRLIALAALLFLTGPMRCTAPGAWAAAAPRVSTAGIPSADAQTEALLTFLKNRDYAGAFKLFDANMKAVVTEEKLKALWEVQLAPLGRLTAWTMAPIPPQQGFEVRVGTLKFENGGLQGTVAVDPKTGLISGFYVKPMTPSPARTLAAYVDTTAFRAVEVPVGREPYLLGGTLTIPKGPGPFPAAVLIHGSGPADRDETIGANRVFRDLAEGLSSHGVAVLRYDKRTLRYGASMKGPITLDTEVIDDARAAIQLLRARKDIDPKRIFVIGHSLGAFLAPEIGVRAAPVAGVALLAPPGRSPYDIIVAQMRYLEAPDKEIVEIERKIALIKSGKGDTETLLGASGAYWKEWAARDEIAMAKKLGRPILILHGDRDFQVVNEDIAAWRKGLAGIAHVEFATFPGLSHLFIKGEGKPSPSEYDIPGHVEPAVIERLHAFIAPPAATAR
ncbi:MAG: alpha/beta fold hydrolase [Candidatus Eiseniibacteriota bacterium]